MDDYLVQTLTKLNSTNYADLTIVMGNESCDLDSAIASIVYANFLHWKHQQLQCKVCTRNHRTEDTKEDIFVPILNVDREDYELKTEVAFCLQEHGISKSELVFRDDFNLEELLMKTKTDVVLVDHHVLAEKDKFLAPHVTEIIDHRPIDKTEWCYRDDTRSTIEVVGSCCTLVTQRIMDISHLMKKDGEFFKAYPNSGELLHCAIILDTVNFSKEVKKATRHDVEVVEYIEGLIKPNDVLAERQCKAERLVEARGDVSALSPAQLLRKDVKVVADVLVPSFPILVEEFLSLPGALQAVSGALSRRGCSVALLLGMSLQGGLRRDAALFGEDKHKTAQLATFLEEWSRPPLQLSRSDTPDCQHYQQLNLAASRKQYMPAINDFLLKYSGN